MAIEDEFEELRPRKKWKGKKKENTHDRFEHRRKAAKKRAIREKLDVEDEIWLDDFYEDY